MSACKLQFRAEAFNSSTIQTSVEIQHLHTGHLAGYAQLLMHALGRLNRSTKRADHDRGSLPFF